MKKFNSKSCEEIMTTVYKSIEFVVDGLFAQGLYSFVRIQNRLYEITDEPTERLHFGIMS